MGRKKAKGGAKKARREHPPKKDLSPRRAAEVKGGLSGVGDADLYVRKTSTPSLGTPTLKSSLMEEEG